MHHGPTLILLPMHRSGITLWPLACYFVGPPFAAKTALTPWTPLDPWRCAVVSGTKMLAADPLSPVSCQVGPPWIGIVCPAHPTDDQLEWDLGNLEAKSTPQTCCYAPQTIPEPFLLCGTTCYPAERGHNHRGIPFPWKSLNGLQQCVCTRCQSNTHKDARTQELPPGHCPKHHRKCVQ